MKNILVTGGAGFIGSNLCEYLLDKGHKIYCLDAFFSGKKENIQHLLKNSNFILIKHNIINPIKFKFKKIDYIYNLACPASPVQYQFDPIMTTKTSVDGIQNVLNLARKYNARVLHTSTSEVYGDPLEHPQKEDYFGNVDCLGKRSCYDEGKRVAESLCKDYNLLYDVDIRIVRLFNVYGPKMMFNDGRVVSNFLLQAILGDDITVHGTGEQTRSFLYIDDLIEGITKIMDVDLEIIGIGPVNIGNPDERSITSLAHDIKIVSKSQSKIIYQDYESVPERLGDPKQRQADISKIKSMTDWHPKTSFDIGIKKTYLDFKNRIDNKSKILIFVPTYKPFMGPSEFATEKIIENIYSYDFDLITAKCKRGLKGNEKIGRVNIYRVGLGTGFDKYLLPIIGLIKAIKLNKNNNYQVVWGVMASYGALTGILFSILKKKALLLSLFEERNQKKKSIKRKIFSPLYKIIFKNSYKLQVVAKASRQQLAWLEDDKNIQYLDFDKGWKYVAQKTKEDFQQVEIKTSRL